MSRKQIAALVGLAPYDFDSGKLRRARDRLLPLPIPQPGGSIELLKSYLNLPNPNDFVLVVTWLLATLRCRLVLDGDMLVTQLSPHGDDLGEPFDRVVPLHNSCRHDGDILCDQSCIEAIVLGQNAAGASELTKLVRVDASHRHSGYEQGTDDATLVTAARLKAKCGDRERAQPCGQLGPAGRVVTTREDLPLAQYPCLKAFLRRTYAS